MSFRMHGALRLGLENLTAIVIESAKNIQHLEGTFLSGKARWNTRQHPCSCTRTWTTRPVSLRMFAILKNTCCVGSEASKQENVESNEIRPNMMQAFNQQTVKMYDTSVKPLCDLRGF